MVDERRLGQLKWFTDGADPVFGKLNKRIETVSEFSTKTAEGFQSVNYGLGGHFDVHVDAFTDVCDSFLFFYLIGNIQNILIHS